MSSFAAPVRINATHTRKRDADGEQSNEAKQRRKRFLLSLDDDASFATAPPSNDNRTQAVAKPQLSAAKATIYDIDDVTFIANHVPLKSISVEASFDLRPLLLLDKLQFGRHLLLDKLQFGRHLTDVADINHIFSEQSHWQYPAYDISDSRSQVASQSTTKSHIDATEFWSIDGETRVNDSSDSTNLRSQAMNWQEALFSVLNGFESGRIGSFYVFGDSSHASDSTTYDNQRTARISASSGDVNSGLYASAVFRRSNRMSNGSTTVPLCILIGVGKQLLQRLDSLGEHNCIDIAALKGLILI